MVDVAEKIKIIYEDEFILVLNKPPGWVVTSTDGQKQEYLVEEWIGENFPNNLPRKGIVHRLDKGTSGILLVAKTEKSLDDLKKQFKNRGVRKHYWAVVGGDLPKSGYMKVPIIRSNYAFSKFKVGVGGKSAETEFKLLKKLKVEGRTYSLVDINLKTGRTHQIRVHFNYMGWPLVGDKTYGGAMVGGLTRPWLHAYELNIILPNTGKTIKFEAPLPVDLDTWLKLYE